LSGNTGLRLAWDGLVGGNGRMSEAQIQQAFELLNDRETKAELLGELHASSEREVKQRDSNRRSRSFEIF